MNHDAYSETESFEAYQDELTTRRRDAIWRQLRGRLAPPPPAPVRPQSDNREMLGVAIVVLTIAAVAVLAMFL